MEHDEVTLDGHMASVKVNGGDGNTRDLKIVHRQMPPWLSYSTPDEFLVWELCLVRSHCL